MNEYSTKEIERILLAERITLRNDNLLLDNKDITVDSGTIRKHRNMREQIVNSIFAFFDNAYSKQNLKFLSYDNPEDLLNKSFIWKIEYDGKLNNFDEFDINKCIAIKTYNIKFGLKGVASGVNPNIDKQKRKAAYRRILREDFSRVWCEVSGATEHLMLKYGGDKYIIDPVQLREYVYAKTKSEFKILKDGAHYSRFLSDGTPITKIAIGTIKIPGVKTNYVKIKTEEEIRKEEEAVKNTQIDNVSAE